MPPGHRLGVSRMTRTPSPSRRNGLRELKDSEVGGGVPTGGVTRTAVTSNLSIVDFKLNHAQEVGAHDWVYTISSPGFKARLCISVSGVVVLPLKATVVSRRHSHGPATRTCPLPGLPRFTLSLGARRGNRVSGSSRCTPMIWQGTTLCGAPRAMLREHGKSVEMNATPTAAQCPYRYHMGRNRTHPELLWRSG